MRRPLGSHCWWLVLLVVELWSGNDSCEAFRPSLAGRQRSLFSAKSRNSALQAATVATRSSSDVRLFPRWPWRKGRKQRSFKRHSFSSIWSQRAEDISLGQAQMLLKLRNKNMLFVNWELSADGAEQLASDLRLAERGFSLTRVGIQAGDEERHMLTLNVYDVEFDGFPGGLTNAVRFEFSIYVQSRDDPRPRFMVVEALSSIDTYDPVSGPVSASKVDFSRDDNVISARIFGPNGWHFQGTVDSDSPTTVNKAWTTATDIVYWPNGVADRCFYDSSLASQSPVLMKHGKSQGEFRWDKYLAEPSKPSSTFLFEQDMEFVCMPWYNLNDDSLQLTQDRRSQLQELKSVTFGGLAGLKSLLVSMGRQEPLVDVVAYGEYPNSPRVVLNFEVPPEKVEEFERTISLPEGYRVSSKIQMTDGGTPKYMLTFSAFLESLLHPGDSPFYKAVWATYIEPANGDDGAFLYEFHVETSASGLCLENKLKQAADTFDVATANEQLRIRIVGEETEATIEVPFVDLSGRSKAPLSDRWVHAHDKVFGRRGLYDKVYYDGMLWNAHVIPVSESDGSIRIEQKAPWSSMVEDHPFQVLFFDRDVSYVKNPWYNIEEV